MINEIHAIAKELLAVLFQGERRREEAEFDAILTINNEILKNNYIAVTYNGVCYAKPEYSYIPCESRPAVAFYLYPRMDAYVEDLRLTRLDEDMFKQCIFKLTCLADTWQETRDALPECLVACSPQLSKLPRTKEAAYLIKDDPRAMKQYKALLVRMEMYYATRLMY